MSENESVSAETVAHLRDAVGNEGAVLGGQCHHVGDRSERRDFGKAAPETRLAQPLAQNLHELEGNARSGKLAARAVVGDLGIGHGNARGHEVRRFVMVGHHDVDAPLGQVGHLVARSDAVVDCDNEIGNVVGNQALERRHRQPVALVEAMRNKRRHLRAEHAKRLGKQARRGDAVDVEVAENGDALA